MIPKSHPYEYINESNFELVKTSLKIGIQSGKSPSDIAQMMHQSTGLPLPVCMAIIQSELLDSIKSLKVKEDMEDGGVMDNGDKAPI